MKPLTLRLIFLCFAFAIPSNALAVDCTSLSINLGSQEEVDNFQATYGGGGICDTVEFDLMVNSASITNLDGLSALKHVGMDFDIWNTSVPNLNALSNLVSVGGHFSILDNPLLTNIDGLSNYTIGQTLYLYLNPLLANLDGLSGLVDTDIGILIENNVSLNNIDGLSSLQHVRRLDISSSPALTNLDSLVNLNTVDQLLHIRNNDALVDLDGLRNLGSVGNLDIDANEVLTNVDGLSSLISVSDGARVIFNPRLQHCAGLIPLLDGLDDGLPGPGPGVGGVPDVGTEVIVVDNHPACSTVQQILDAEASASLRVSKLYSDDNTGPVTISVDCENPAILVETINSSASPGMEAEFEVRRFIPGFGARCSATEEDVPSGYSADESACESLEMTNGSSPACAITNSQNPIPVTVFKEYVNPQPGVDPEVTVTLTCPMGSILPATSMLTSGGVAAFEVLDVPSGGVSCDVTETVPPGYIQVEAEGCTALMVKPGAEPTLDCTFRNDVDPDQIFFDGFEN